jgi:hypothetical protein
MTVQEAIDKVLEVGTIRAENGKLKVRFPEPELARLESAIEILRRNRETALKTLSGVESCGAGIPSAAEWQQSLSELAPEVGQRSGGIEATRQEVWMDWCEWKAEMLNQLFLDMGSSGKPGKITAATVRHGSRQ